MSRQAVALLLALFLALNPAAAQSPFGGYSFQNITTDTTTIVKESPGFLHTLCINTPAANGTITIYDNTRGSGTKIGTITPYASTNPCMTCDVSFLVGLTIVTATAAPDITVTFR
jgi:hypothetical protein